VTLADLYDADRRRRDPEAARLAAAVRIPHPLHGVEYSDGVERCTHARRCWTVLGKPAG